LQGVKGYLFSILATAIIVSISISLSSKQKAISGLIKTIGSVVLIITIAYPLVNLKEADLSSHWSSFQIDANSIIEDAKDKTAKETASIISDEIQTYIKDKARTYGAEVHAVVSLTEPENIIPDTVIIEGQVSPYTKSVLQKIIVNDLGIAEEKQIWK